MIVTGGGTPRDTSRKGRGDPVSRPADSLNLVIKLESDVKRLKCDLQLCRNRENELREQIVCYMSSKLFFFFVFLLVLKITLLK